MNSLREVDGAEAMLVSSLSVTFARDQLELAELAGSSVCLLYSVSHKQLIQLARRGQPDQLGADFWKPRRRQPGLSRGAREAQRLTQATMRL